MTDHDRAGHGGGQAAPAVAEASSKAIELLALRPHFRAELAAKLSRRGFDGAVIDEVLERLEEIGYLDDLAAARGFAEQRLRRQCWGPRRLRAELSRRGVEEQLVSSVVDEAFAAGEREAVGAAAERWRGKGGRGRERLARYLDRQGFSKGAIVEILTELAAGSENQNEEF